MSAEALIARRLGGRVIETEDTTVGTVTRYACTLHLPKVVQATMTRCQTNAVTVKTNSRNACYACENRSRWETTGTNLTNLEPPF